MLHTQRSLVEEARAMAADGDAYIPPRTGVVVEDLGDIVVRHNPQGPHHWWGAATRPRFTGSDAEERIDVVRRWMREHGRAAFTWWIGDRATPADLVDRLVAMGAVPEPTDPEFTAMVLDHEPPPGSADVEIRPITTLDQYVERMRIVLEDEPPDVVEASVATLPDIWPAVEADRSSRYLLAYLDGEPVGEAVVIFLTNGVPFLAGGSTRRRARGRGIYRALVRARWDEAVRRGAPVLTVQAGRMSAPILERLGFEAVGRGWAVADRSDL